MKAVETELLHTFHEEAVQDSHIRTLQAAMAKTDLKDLAYLPQQAAKLKGAFSIEVKTHGIDGQEKSGRCWMFAAMNLLREKAAAKMHIKEFHLSGCYLEFFDKLEKANNVFEMAIAHAQESYDARINEYILAGFGDGGYWQMDVDLIKKYGVVPLEVMPETYQSNHTQSFREVLNHLMHKDVALLRKAVLAKQDVQNLKKQLLQEVYRYLCTAFGTPPETFRYDWRDTEDQYHTTGEITPKQFYKQYIDVDLDQYVVVTNYPCQHRKINSVYSFHYIGSSAESNIINLNLPMEELEELCIKQLKQGEPVWFGCDSQAYGARKEGIWDIDSFTYDQLAGSSIFLDKKTRLETHDSSATHAMLLVGVDLDEKGHPQRWKIENSWGNEVGDKGYFVCSERYFKEYVYEAVIDQNLLNDKQKGIFHQTPYQIDPWQY